jgi:hypothetical protein
MGKFRGASLIGATSYHAKRGAQSDPRVDGRHRVRVERQAAPGGPGTFLPQVLQLTWTSVEESRSRSIHYVTHRGRRGP